MDEFEKELKQGFLEEATQLLSQAEQRFLALESNPTDRTLLEDIFRLAHNLKGSGNAVGFSELGHFTHELESFLLKLKENPSQVQSDSVDLLLRCNDHITGMVSSLRENLEAKIDSSSLLEELKAAMQGKTQSTPAHEPAPVAEPTPAPTLAAAKKPQSSSDDSVRVRLDRLEKLLNFVGELVIYQTVLKEQAYATNPTPLRRTIHQMGKVTKEVQDLSMSLRMIPVKQTFQKMTRIVRDTSASLGKSVQLILSGEDTELDKTVLENVSDPLVHLIRNAVDHGIESKEARIAKGQARRRNSPSQGLSSKWQPGFGSPGRRRWTGSGTSRGKGDRKRHLEARNHSSCARGLSADFFFWFLDEVGRHGCLRSRRRNGRR